MNAQSPKGQTRGPFLVSPWILICSLAAFGGWVLSAIHELNVRGYICLGIMALILAAAVRSRISRPKRCCQPRKFKSRFSRFFPAVFLIFLVLTGLSGLLYAPSNYDGLAYRTPRVLHWLAHQRWYWIPTEFHRLNTRAANFEWLTAPIILFFKTDRPIFLINLCSFAILPGLVFHVFTRLGVPRRVAWYWMWLVPTGYCFLLQAGSIGNDLFGSALALAAISFALRARESRNIYDIYLSLLAAALMTGSKASNLPLLLPWLIALFPVLPVLFRRAFLTVLVGIVSAIISFLPQMALNVRHCGDWSGMAAEHTEFTRGKPALRVANNAVLLVLQNIVPPVFPLANAWDAAVDRYRPASWSQTINPSFEPVGGHWRLPEMQTEEAAGLGCGLSLLLAGSWIAARWRSLKRQQIVNDCFPHARLVLLGSLVALTAYMAKSGLSTPSRVIAPYYCFLIPLLLRNPGQALLVCSRGWKLAAAVVCFLAAMPLVLSPGRPLFPARTLIALAPANAPLAIRAKAVYSVYAKRADAFAPARASLPPNLKVVGYLGLDYPETSLWRPFGSRIIKHINRGDNAATLRNRGIEYILVNTKNFELMETTFEPWLKTVHAEIIKKLDLNLRATAWPGDWYLVHVTTIEVKNLSSPAVTF
jgi:hypothetical protein